MNFPLSLFLPNFDGELPHYQNSIFLLFSTGAASLIQEFKKRGKLPKTLGSPISHWFGYPMIPHGFGPSLEHFIFFSFFSISSELVDVCLG